MEMWKTRRETGVKRAWNGVNAYCFAWTHVSKKNMFFSQKSDWGTILLGLKFSTWWKYLQMNCTYMGCIFYDYDFNWGPKVAWVHLPSFLAMSAGAAAILARAKLLRQGVAARLFKYMFMKLKKCIPFLLWVFFLIWWVCQCSARNKDEKEKGL